MGLKPVEEEQALSADGKFLEPEDEAVPNFMNDETADDEDASSGRGLQSYPASLDWREMGVVNPIRNQGFCCSCYTFYTVASVKGMYRSYGTEVAQVVS
jgi:C1A family cysteine protease